MAARTVEIKFLGSTAQLEAALERAGLTADAAGKKIGDKFTEGTNRASGALGHLSNVAGSFGLPFTTTLDRIGEKLSEAETKTQRFSTALQEAGKVTLLAGTAGFAGAAAEAVKLGEKFQSTTASIAANAGITQKAADNIGNAFLNTAGKSIFSGQQMASAFQQVAGQLKLTEGHALSVAEATRVMSAASDLAEAANTDLASSTSALAGVMQAYHLSVSQAASTSDTLFNISKSINVPLDGVATALERLHGRLGELAPSLRDVGGLLIDLAGHGVTGQRGVQVVNTALTTLVSNSKQTDAMLRALGVSVFDSSGRFIGLQSVISQLQPKLAGLTEQQRLFAEKALFGSAAGKLLGQVIADGVPKFQQAADVVNKAGTAQSAAQLHSKTLHNEMETLKATVEDLGTKFGLFLIPKLQQLGSWLASGITWLEKHKAAAVALGAAIAGPLALAVTAFIAGQAKGFVDAIGRMGASMIALATTSKTTGAEIVASADTTAAGVDTALGSTGVGLVLVGLGVAATELATHWQTVMDAMGSAVNAMVQAAESALNGLISVLNGAITVFNSTIGQITGQIGQLGSVSTSGLGGSSGGMFDTAHGLAPFVAPSFSTASGGSVPVPSSGSNASRIAGALKAQGFSNVAIAGILGNFAQENGGQTLSGISTSSGPGGVGIAQWIGSRATEEGSYAALHHESPNSLAAQVGFLVQELRTGYHGVFNQIQHASSPQQAALLFEQGFERAGLPNNPVRESVAAQAYAWLTGGSGGGGGGSSSGAGNARVQALINAAASGKSTAAKAIRTLLYANPLPGLTSVGRTDQGVDFSATPGSPVNAIGAGRIVDIVANWYKGQPLVEEQLTQGPNKGQYVYYAEQLRSLVHLGQMVGAGQRIGTVAPSGTGLELGFGAPGGRTLAQATTGYQEGQVTPAGQAFARFFASIRNGIYTTTSGGITTGGGQNFGITIAQAVQNFIQALDKTTNSLIQSYQALEQNGSVKTLTKALGVGTGAGVAQAIRTKIEGLDPAQVQKALTAGTDPHQLDQTLIPILERAASRSQATQQFNTLVAELRGSGQGGQANALISARGGVFAALAQEMYAQQVTKDAESITLQATQEKDRTTIATNEAAARLQIVKDSQQKTIDHLSAQTTAIKDMTQTITDRFSAMAQTITDRTTEMADASNAVVQGINDQTQIRVDILGERGLFGLNLIAQREQVQLDIMKAGFDQQIAAAQSNLDIVKSTENQIVSQKQLQLDQITAAQDQLVSMAQFEADTAQLSADSKIAAAQAHADSVTLAQDIAVQLAQTAVDLSANAPKAQQDAANAQLKRATARATKAEADANAALGTAQSQANALVNQAQAALAQAQGRAAEAEATAQQALTTAQGQANVAIAQATQALQGVQDTAAQAEAGLQGKIDITKATASTQFAGSGITINQYGVDLSDPTSMARGMDWLARTQLAALS